MKWFPHFSEQFMTVSFKSLPRGLVISINLSFTGVLSSLPVFNELWGGPTFLIAFQEWLIPTARLYMPFLWGEVLLLRFFLWVLPSSAYWLAVVDCCWPECAERVGTPWGVGFETVGFEEPGAGSHKHLAICLLKEGWEHWKVSSTLCLRIRKIRLQLGWVCWLGKTYRGALLKSWATSKRDRESQNWLSQVPYQLSWRRDVKAKNMASSSSC